MTGGGIWPSMMAWYQEKENKGGVEAMPLIPPVLTQEGDKVRSPWLFGFLKEPYTLRPIVKVHMPNFRFTDAEAKAVSVYFPEQQRKTYPRRLTLDTRHQVKLTPEQLAAQANLGSPERVRALEKGLTPNRETMDRLEAFARAKHVASAAPPEILEFVPEREAAYRAAREAEHKDYFDKAATIAAQSTAGNCYSCHFRGDVKPSGQEDSWAPDLSRVRERLRPDWSYRWISDPQSISPGTKMPAPAEYPAIFDAPRAVQMRALNDLLFNWDFYLALVMPQPKVAMAPAKDEKPADAAKTEKK
jgi:cbb3-type cytochrome oxidase cytochrome c subunit